MSGELRRGDVIKMKRGARLVSGFTGYGVVSRVWDDMVHFTKLDGKCDRRCIAMRHEVVKVRGLPQRCRCKVNP